MEEYEKSSRKERNIGTGSWAVRRRIIIISLIFSAGIITYLTIFGQDNRLHESIATGMIFFASSVIGSYVFGAVWEDKGRQ